MARGTYWAALSARQKAGFVGAVLAGLGVAVAGGFLVPAGASEEPVPVDVQMTIKQVAPALKMTGLALAIELNLPADAPRNKPLADLGVSPARLEEAVGHAVSHRPATIKYFRFAGIVLFGLVFLTWLGRPALAGPADLRARYPRWPYLACLAIAVVACGFALGKSPNPMEGAVKVFKSAAGLYPAIAPYLLALGFFLALAIVGNKLVCGWACPFGALQELIYSLPFFRRLKRRAVPFWLTNTIRVGLFGVMLLVLFGSVGGAKGYVLYHPLNPFNLFDWQFEHWLIATTVVVMLVLSLGIYRPFCYLVCPFGLLSWPLERISLARVRVDRESCNECGACARACPSQAARHILDNRMLGADCFSCARCLNVCPSDSLRFAFPGRRPPSQKLRDR